MSDEDFMSETYLVQAETNSKPKTYAQRREDARRESERKMESNRRKSKKQLQQESREEGLSKSLFERAKEEEEQGLSKGPNKALAMMEKMGFVIGQSLGKKDEAITPKPILEDDEGASAAGPSKLSHKIEPLPVSEWTGKQGIGAGVKRARPPSPTSAQRVAKMAKMAEQETHESFRDRTRRDYLERRAEGQLVTIQQTCISLDEKSDVPFHVLWLNPNDDRSFPEGLLDTLRKDTNWVPLHSTVRDRAAHLRQQMQAYALQSMLKDNDDELVPSKVEIEHFSEETVVEAAQFLSLTARNRLEILISYLRNKHIYCFWCGTAYEELEELQSTCPGEDEESHD